MLSTTHHATPLTPPLRTRKRSSLSLWAIVFVSTFLCVAPARSQDPITVIAVESEPMLYLEAGNPAGFEYDILAAFAKSIDRKLEVRWAANFPELLESVANGAVDVGGSAITATAERERVMEFSTSHFPSQVYLVVVKESGYGSVGSLAGAGSRFGLMKGTTLESLATALFPKMKIYEANEMRPLFEALARKELDAVPAEAPAAFLATKQFPILALGEGIGKRQHLAFALPKGSDLTSSLNRYIEQLKLNGYYYQLVEKHLGREAAALMRNRE